MEGGGGGEYLASRPDSALSSTPFSQILSLQVIARHHSYYIYLSYNSYSIYSSSSSCL